MTETSSYTIRKRKTEGFVDIQVLKEKNQAVWRRLNRNRARLRTTASTSIVLSAFAMESMVELQVNIETKCPSWLFTLFAVCTTSLISLHILSLTISTFVLPNIDAVGRHIRHRLVVQLPPENLRLLVELAWTCSTVFGLFLFLIEIVLLCWVKFWDYSILACWAGTLAVCPFLVAYIVFSIYFHRMYINLEYNIRSVDIKGIVKIRNELENIQSGFLKSDAAYLQ